MLSGNLFKSTNVQVWETRPLFSCGTQFRQIVLDENSIPFKWRWKTWQQTRQFPLQTQPKSFYQQGGQHLLMHASLIWKMCRQTDRLLGNLIHYSTYDHTVPLLGHVLSFHWMLQCVGMHVVSCLSVHTHTHTHLLAHLVSTEHGGRVVVSCFHNGRSWLKISV